MNEEMNRKCLRQVENIRGHFWHRYSITANHVMVATVKLSKWWLQLETLASVASLLPATLFKGNPDRNHTPWNVVSTDIYVYSIFRCCWNVANSLNTEQKTTTIDVGNPGPDSGQAQHMAGLNRLMNSQHPLLITGSKTELHILTSDKNQLLSQSWMTT